MEKLHDRFQELYNDVVMYDDNIISSTEFFVICEKYYNQESFDKFENSVTMCIDTGNLEALSTLLV